LATILESAIANGIKILLLLTMSKIIHEYNNGNAHQVFYYSSRTIKRKYTEQFDHFLTSFECNNYRYFVVAKNYTKF
jgi:hypothetical protein